MRLHRSMRLVRRTATPQVLRRARSSALANRNCKVSWQLDVRGREAIRCRPVVIMTLAGRHAWFAIVDVINASEAPERLLEIGVCVELNSRLLWALKGAANVHSFSICSLDERRRCQALYVTAVIHEPTDRRLRKRHLCPTDQRVRHVGAKGVGRPWARVRRAPRQHPSQWARALSATGQPQLRNLMLKINTANTSLDASA